MTQKISVAKVKQMEKGKRKNWKLKTGNL